VAVFHVAHRGYAVAHRDELLKSVWGAKNLAEELLAWPAIDEASFAAGLDRLFAPRRQEDIDLWSRTGASVLFTGPGDTVATDHSAILGLVDEMFAGARSLQGEHGAMRGDDFEDYTELAINRQHLPGTLVFRKEILRRGGRDVAEIDIGWRVKDVLFVIDCKARGMHPALDRGEAAALAIRRRDLVKDLEQVANAAATLQTDFRPRIPEGVTCLIPLVVTAFPEYLPERTERWWLPGDVPRVLTPHELGDAFSIPSEILRRHVETLVV